MRYALSAITVATLALLPSQILACTNESKCITSPAAASNMPFSPGDVLPRGEYNLLLNSEYYGLPEGSDNAWYFRVKDRVVRVRPSTMEIIDDVTHLTNAAF